MAREYTFEEIESYLEGGMSAADKLAFESALASDQLLAENLRRHKESHAMVEMYARSSIKSKIKAIHDAKLSNASTKKREAFPMMRIAASLALLIVAGALYLYLGSTYSPSHLANEAFEPYPNRFRTLGTNENTDFNKALNAYDEQDYSQAINLFAKIAPDDEKYVDAQFYLGVSNLGSEKYQEALAPLKYVVESESLYEGSASWYLCLVYLQLEREDEAKEILRSIASKGGKKAKIAEELLDKLESRFRDFPFVE